MLQMLQRHKESKRPITDFTKLVKRAAAAQAGGAGPTKGEAGGVAGDEVVLDLTLQLQQEYQDIMDAQVSQPDAVCGHIFFCWR